MLVPLVYAYLVSNASIVMLSLSLPLHFVHYGFETDHISGHAVEDRKQFILDLVSDGGDSALGWYGHVLVPRGIVHDDLHKYLVADFWR